MTAPAVDIQNLAFSYSHPQHTCFSGLNLKINAGARFGLFGPNGAGKTTLMSCMTGLLAYDSGSVFLSGLEIKKNPKAIKKTAWLCAAGFCFLPGAEP